MNMPNSTKLPFGRTGVEGAAEILGFGMHEIPILVKSGLLPPLGGKRVPANGHKFWARSHLMRCAQDEQWLSKATLAVYAHWERKNRKHSETRKQMAAA